MSTDKLHVGDFGDDVTQLHENLKKHGFDVSAEEAKRKFFGPMTREAVGEFQKAHGIDPSCEVCEATASFLATQPVAPTAASSSTVSLPTTANAFNAGAVALARSDAVAPQPFSPIATPPGPFPLGAQATPGPTIPSGGAGGATETVDATAPTTRRAPIGVIVRPSPGIRPPIDVVVPNPDEPPAPSDEQSNVFLVLGKVSSRFRAGVGGLRIEIVDKNVGEDVRLAETSTDDGGAYQSEFTIVGLRRRGKQEPDLQARVFVGDTFLGTSEVRYNASNREVLDVLIEPKAAAALPSEHETLTGSIAAHFRGSLRDLKETDDRQDITYLANKTGWDARAVALAALADQFSATTTEASNGYAIEPPFFYALFRAGLPANESALYQTDAKTAAAIWQKGIAEGVIPPTLEKNIPRALERFQSLAAQRLVDGETPVGVSPLKEMLIVSLSDDPGQHKQFAEIYTRYRGEPRQFWEAVRGAFGEPVEKRLKVDGQLGYLTLNNATLIRKLHETAGENGLTDTVDLAKHGYYHAEQWHRLFSDGTVPPEVPGASDEEKRARYAALLAAQVRFSFPTAVVAQMVALGETPVATGLNESVHSFLMAHHGTFEIGMQPVEQYIARNELQVVTEVIREVTKIQRVYQITPNDEAMNALLKNGIDSAYAVVGYDRDEFVQAFKDEMGGEANARLTYAKSQQVHTAVLNIAISYLIASTAPAIGAHSAPQIVDPTPTPPANTADVIAYATLEGLFGEMDYCECEHCRSILSPAAYLVNLLQFIDPPEHKDPSPQKVLFDRRPDIQHLPLTCENTNIPLPYIDLVNETLEYFVFNKLSLEQYEGHDTAGDATPEELLASPQYGDIQASVEAYNILASTHFPPPLPFHQPLENLRRYFDRFETPLPAVMEALRKDESLERANATRYGWRDILMEELRLSRAEYALLTDRTLNLQQLYGYPPAISDADMLADLSNAKAFTRRVGISYAELIEILETRFINPNSTLVPKLERLGVPFLTLKALKDGTITDAQFDALLPPGLDASQYGDDIKAWVKNNANYANIMGLITLTTPILPWAASTVYRRGDCVRPTSPPAGSTTYYECTTPGTSAGVEPSPWPTAPGNTYTDGTVVWTCRVGLNDCSFDALRFRYADPDNNANTLRGFEFIRLIRFIRLWKKLGWSIEHTDKAVTALYPVNQAPNDPGDTVNLQRLDAGFLTLLPCLGVVKRVMVALKLKPNKDLLPLLACFAPIDTHGAVSLYRQMFLSPALLKLDAAFADDGYGHFLTDNTQKLTAHGETLRAAFLLTDDELSQIIAALGYDANTPLGYTPTDQELTPLLGHAPNDRERGTLTQYLRVQNISAVFRRGWLARKLRLSVREFLLLTQFTGIDPFAAPDAPHPPILHLLDLVNKLRAASFKLTQALYLIWNQDVSGKSAPDDGAITGFARTLRADLAAIDSEFAIVDDPDGTIARARMSLVYGNDATDFFFGLLGDTLVTDVPYSHASAPLITKVPYSHSEPNLEPAIRDAAPDRIAYNPTMKELSFLGVLTTAIRDALKNVAGVTDSFKRAVDCLHAENQKVVKANLEQPVVHVVPGHIVYDDFRKRLSYAGVLRTTTRDALKAVAGVTDEFKTAVDKLYADNQKVIGPFFARYPELLPLYDAYVASNDTVVTYCHGQPSLEQSILDAASGRIAYDDVQKQLSYRGQLTAVTRDALKDVTGVSDEFKTAMDMLHAENQKIVGPFLANHTELLTLYQALVASGDSQAKKRSVLIAYSLPALKSRRQRQQALQAISAVAKTDVQFASALLADKYVDNGVDKYILHAAREVSRPALDDVVALGTPGLSAQFFFRDTATGVVDHRPSDPEANLAYSAAGSNKLPGNPVPANTISGIWDGYLETPENGFYNFHIETDAGATVALTLDGKAIDLVPNGNVHSNRHAIELRAGTLYTISFQVEEVKDTLTVRWETAGRGREIIPGRYLYSATLTDHLRGVYVRLLKAASLASALKLTTAEIGYFASHADYRIGGESWLNSLPVSGSPDRTTSTALFKTLSALLDFARLKAELSPDDERLLAVLEDPVAAAREKEDPATPAKKVDSPLFSLTRWQPTSRDALLAHFGKAIADLAHLETFRRVYDSHTWVKKLGVPVSALIEATTNDPDAVTVRDLQAALRARYDEADWLKVLKPINDEMRGLQRDALVAYILHQMRSNPLSEHIDTSEKLFEYFLMDVQMDPCMQTSRIRHALSSVQLFIERCLMNLEPRVAPSSIKAKQWEWMKRYRVWEANRKVFLWPENWLEPELRDDQSPFFKETMSELLQGDITEDRAATALLNYLSKLEEVAKLEPCGIHYVENQPGTADDVAHVVARTAGANRKYFYRRREYGYWTPWEQINLDIEDNPILPVVWKGRLFLFWLRILKQAPLDPTTQAASPGPKYGGSPNQEKRLADVSLSEIKETSKKDAARNTQVTVQAVLCWSEYYNGKWQPTKTSDVNRPAALGEFGPNAFERSNLRLSVVEDEPSGALGVHISGEGASTFFLYNTHSLPLRQQDAFPLLYTDPFGPIRDLDTSTGTFIVTYGDGLQYQGTSLPREVLKNDIHDSTTDPHHRLQDPWDAPFFYEDSRHVFYVTTAQQIVRIPQWDWYGILVHPGQQQPIIPPLVLPPIQAVPDLLASVVTRPHMGLVDPSPIERFITEDAYITRGIGTTGTVRFGGKEIGPSGGLLKKM